MSTSVAPLLTEQAFAPVGRRDKAALSGGHRDVDVLAVHQKRASHAQRDGHVSVRKGNR